MDKMLIDEYLSGAEALEPDACDPVSLAPSPQPLSPSSVVKELRKSQAKAEDAKDWANRVRLELEQGEAKFDEACEMQSMMEEDNDALVIENTQLEAKLKKARDELKEAGYKTKVVLIESVRVERLLEETSEKLTRLKEAKPTLTEEKDVLGEAKKRESALLWELDIDLKSGAEMKVGIVLDKDRAKQV